MITSTNTTSVRSWLRAELQRKPQLERRLVERARRAGYTAIELRAAAATLNVDRGDSTSKMNFWALRPVAKR